MLMLLLLLLMAVSGARFYAFKVGCFHQRWPSSDLQNGEKKERKASFAWFLKTGPRPFVRFVASRYQICNAINFLC